MYSGKPLSTTAVPIAIALAFINNKIFISPIMKHILPLLFTALSLTAPIHAQETPAWQKFANKSQDNILLDFSYAGYHHGLEAPPADVYSLGYTVYNVLDYGAKPNDGKSDRSAVEAIMNKIGSGKPNANAIIYFPEGEYILHSTDDDTKDATTGKVTSNTLNLVMGHVIIKGAGRDKTTLIMDAPMQPQNPDQMYSSPVMLSIRHNGGGDNQLLAKVTGSAKKNDMSIDVDDASKLHVGDWVKLHMKNADQKVIDEELNGLKATKSMSNLKEGVEVIDRHQIKSIDGNRITFEEPIMHAVNPDYGWEILTFSHYEEVGVEDLAFEGYSTEYFHHHASWEDDGAYKPLNFMRLVNSWLRRVDFRSVSECMTFQDCANSLCLDIEISGNRGHSAVRMANSSRGFIGKVYDHSDGYLDADKTFTKPMENLGQYHACGISKHSIGNVIWNCRWGDDACFESHATQPRASLFDQCSGGFMQLRMGGDLAQLPNHLDDLTIWNFDCLANHPSEYPFEWWYPTEAKWYKTMPPTVVGFHGKSVTFAENQMKLNENQGVTVTPGSLYEAQLTLRLGYLPQWVTDAKNGETGISSVKENKWNSDARTYNLSGVQVGKGYKGIVVRKGKKSIEK